MTRSYHAEPVQVLAHIALDLIALEICRAGAGNEDDVVVFLAGDADVGECRADDAAAAVAPDCLADLFGGGDADSKVIFFIFQNVGDKTGRDRRLSAAIEPLEVPVVGKRRILHLTTILRQNSS